VLPATLLALFTEPAEHGAVRMWQSSSGGQHPLTIAAEEQATAPVATALGMDAVLAPADFNGIADATQKVTTVGALIAEGRGVAAGGGASDRVLGLAVHRLLERHGWDNPSADVLRLSVLHALEDEALEDVEDVERLTHAAVSAYEALTKRDDLRALCGGAVRLHEVPFTLVQDGQHVRGTIDCLVQRSDGSIVVLEFKTGRRRPEHERQLEFYVRAARSIFPAAPVDGLLVYASGDAVAT
jgi:ATP-dependent exoDNAse (exonuclease V) beta subunit